MSTGSNKSSGTTVVNNTAPWADQQQYLRTVMSKAQGMYDSGALVPDYYPQSTVAARDAYTTQGEQMQANRAVAGSPLVTGANTQLSKTMSGEYLGGSPGTGTLQQLSSGNTNPFLDSAFNQAAGKAQAALDAKFSMGGRYGSGAHEAASADQLNSLATQIYGGAYEGDQARRLAAASQLGTEFTSGRGQQLLAASMAPTLANQDYVDASKLAEVGTARENYQQALIDDAKTRYDYEQNKDVNALSILNQFVQGNYGSTSSGGTTTSARSNPLASGLSGATAGGGLGYMINGSTGAGYGAALGGLLGLF